MRLLASFVIAASLAAVPGRGAELRVAAASDLGFLLRDLRAVFERTQASRLAVSLGSSGSLYGQIVNGAPFDVFLSADVDYPRRLEEAGLAEPGTLSVYGSGRLVVWVPSSSPLDLERAGLEALAGSAIRKVALASPSHAPYGRAAVAALRHAGIHQRIASKLVYGESVMQAAQFVQSRAADAGIVALSLALAPAMRGAGRYWLVPAGFHPPIEQAGILLRRARSRGSLEAASAFMTLLESDEGRRALAAHGLEAPAAPR